MPRPRAALLVLGAWLVTRGAFAAAGLIVTGLLGAGCAVAAFAMTPGRAAYAPLLASSLVAWGGGATLAFAGARHATRPDRQYGVLALAHARGVGAGQVACGQLAGLVLVLAAATCASIAAACLAAIVATGLSGTALRASVAALGYAVAFSLSVGPIAMAALGAPTRAGGYFALLGILVLPELAAPWTSRALPPGWHELTSIPAALAAVRAGIAHPVMNGAHAARGAAAVAAIATLACLAVVVRARRGQPA